MKKISAGTYRNDRLYPRIVRAVTELLRRGKVVAPVEVLIEMKLLKPKALEDWRRGRVSYLERVIQCNLARLSRLLRILHFHALTLKLKPSITVYMRWGKGPKQRLRFTKTGDRRLEEAYSRHFVVAGKGPSHPSRKKGPDADGASVDDRVSDAIEEPGAQPVEARTRAIRSRDRPAEA